MNTPTLAEVRVLPFLTPSKIRLDELGTFIVPVELLKRKARVCRGTKPAVTSWRSQAAILR